MIQNKKWIGILLVGMALAIGFLLVQQPTKPMAETVERMEAVQEFQEQIQPLAPFGFSNNSSDLVVTERTNDPVVPSVVDFSNVVIRTEDPNSMYERWLRGELDFDEQDGLYTDVEIAAMREESLKLPFDPFIQNATLASQSFAPTLDVSFDSIDFTDSGGFIPPDPEMAAGANHLVVAVNVAVAIYDKSGTLVFGPTVATNLFTQTPCTTNLFDPNIIYDEEAQRWFLAYDQGGFTIDGGYCVLVSQTSDPTGSWNEYFFQTHDNTGWMDYPHAGVGDNYIVMGGNFFSQAGSFLNARIYAFDKTDLYAGDPVTMVERSLGFSAFTPQPLNLHGFEQGTWPNYGDTHYLLAQSTSNGFNSILYQWNPATDIISTVGTVSYGGGATGFPLDVLQSGGFTVDGGSSRPQDFEYRNGYGWTSIIVACNPGTGAVNCVRWAQIDLTDASFGSANNGVYGSNGDYRFHADLAVNRCDDMAIGYSKSNSSSFISTWVTGRESTDTAGTLQAEMELKAGEIAYTDFTGNTSGLRWGDYTGMTIDPDGETFWYLGQYSKDTGTHTRWGNYVASFSYPNCANAPIAVTDGSVEISLAPDDTLVNTFTISNTGGSTLTWTMDEDAGTAVICDTPTDISWLSISPTSGDVISSTTNTTALAFDSTGLSTGIYTGTLCLQNNAYSNAVTSIPVTMNVCNAPTGSINVTMSNAGNNTMLTWSTVGADFYEIHWSTTPYFTPSSSTLQATSATGSYTHMGSNGASYYYSVIPADNCGNSSVTGTNSNATGSFEFTITPGT